MHETITISVFVLCTVLATRVCLAFSRDEEALQRAKDDGWEDYLTVDPPKNYWDEPMCRHQHGGKLQVETRATLARLYRQRRRL